MSALLNQVIDYARDNPGIIAGTCLAVLLVGVTQIVLTISTTKTTALTDTYTPYPLIDKRSVCYNTRIFRFALPTETSTLGLPLGRHISLRATINGKDVRRPYTPISSDSTQGYFELLIKVYPDPYGLMSRHLDSLPLGGTIDVRGPRGKFEYARNSCRTLLMVCGGTGITPMWQVFKAILDDPNDMTQLVLVFANLTIDDILLREELDELHQCEERFSRYYVLDKPPGHWAGGKGYVTKEILEDQFGEPEGDSMVLMCGPPPMNKAIKSTLLEMGYVDSQIFKF